MNHSSHSLELIPVDHLDEKCSCQSSVESTTGQGHLGSHIKKTLAGWLKWSPQTSTGVKSKPSLSVSTSSLSSTTPKKCPHCQKWKPRNGEKKSLGRSKKISWSKLRRRLASKSSQGKDSPNDLPATRALPPVPTPSPIPDLPTSNPPDEMEHELYHDIDEQNEEAGIAFVPPIIDLATSIEKVKSYGWYWGPISREASEHLLSNEPDGSFIVRDSSADRYIFSLTFKLDDNVRHVRIENDQGFSFGSPTPFKSNTIVDFIENAVEYSRSGRFLFFLHRRPERGPMRVQLLNPISRFKQVQSLQHMCRFVILKLVPRVLLSKLPVPKRIRAYLDTPFYFSEAIADSSLPGNEPLSKDGDSDTAKSDETQLEEDH